MATEEKRVMSDEDDRFAADFRDGEAMAKEWMAGKGDLPDLLHIVRDMPRGALGGLEAGFLVGVDAAVRGRREASAPTPDLARAKQLLVPPAAEPAAPAIDVDEFRRQMHQRQARARLEELMRRNSILFVDQGVGAIGPRGGDWW